jgi:hypothetical protein
MMYQVQYNLLTKVPVTAGRSPVILLKSARLIGSPMSAPCALRRQACAPRERRRKLQERQQISRVPLRRSSGQNAPRALPRGQAFPRVREDQGERRCRHEDTGFGLARVISPAKERRSLQRACLKRRRSPKPPTLMVLQLSAPNWTPYRMRSTDWRRHAGSQGSVKIFGIGGVGAKVVLARSCRGGAGLGRAVA